MEPFDGSESAENILNRLLEESRAEDAAAVPPSTSEHQHEAVRLSAGTAEVSPEAMRHEENHPRDADMLAVIDDQSSIHQPQHYNGEIRYSHNMQPEQQPQQQLLNPTEMNGAQSGVHGATYNSQRHPQENNLTLQQRVHFHPYQNTQSQQEYATETRSTDADTRKDLASSILLTGGCSLMKGMEQQLSLKVAQHATYKTKQKCWPASTMSSDPMPRGLVGVSSRSILLITMMLAN